MKASIVIASYGNHSWELLGNRRAVPSAKQQNAHEVIRFHEPQGRIATCRNAGAEQATGDWLIFLDADDELAPGYVDAMRAALAATEDQLVLLAPAASYSHGRNFRKAAKFWPECDIRDGNWLVIGTAVPRTLWQQVGGFDDKPEYGAFEDWAFWIKCIKAGATPTKVPAAVYQAHVSSRSRHRSQSHTVRLGWHYAVGRDHYPDVYTEQWLAQYGRVRPSAMEARVAARERRRASTR